MKNRTIIFLLALALSVQFSCAQNAEEYQNSDNYKRAIELLNNDGDEKEALDYLHKEIQEHPNNGYAYYWIGLVHEKHGNRGIGLEAADNAIELLKEDKEWISYAYRMRARIYLGLDNDNKALADWDLSLKANPTDFNTLDDRAEYYWNKREYALSNKDYEAIIAAVPTNTLGYMGKGRNAVYNKNFEEAKELFTYALKLDPKLTNAYSFRAECYLALKLYNEAIDDMIVALSEDDDRAVYLMQELKEPEVNVFLAKLQMQAVRFKNESRWPGYIGVVYELLLFNYPKAIEHYNKALKLKASDVYFARVAYCCEKMGGFDLALNYIEQAIALDSTDYDYVMEKGDLLYESGDTKAAIQVYDKYIEYNPDDFGGYYRRGFMKDNVDDTDGAIEDYSTSILLNLDFAYAYVGRGDKYLLKGEKELAMADYRKAVALDTVYEESNCAQYAYLGLGEKKKAIAFMDSILVHSPSMGNYYDAACLYARMGKKEMSVDYLCKSLEKGFRRFSHIERDDDLTPIREMEKYKLWMDGYMKKAKTELTGILDPKMNMKPDPIVEKIMYELLRRHDALVNQNKKIEKEKESVTTQREIQGD